MIRLNVVVEGQTEETFVREVLVPDLAPRGVFATARLVETKAEGPYRKRGGGRRYAKWRKDLLTWMKQDDHRDVWFTTMVDLYGLPKDFPAYTEAHAVRNPAHRVRLLEEGLREDLNHPRFIPYVQLHEFEALLFADVSAFAAIYPKRAESVTRLAEERRGFRTVDEIDDGQETAPTKRIRRCLP
jgi:hypothetical protein